MPTSEQDIRRCLLDFAKTIPPAELTPTLTREAGDFVASDPFAFVLACSLDRQTKVETIWAIPYWLREIWGHLDPEKISQMDIHAMRTSIEKLPMKPRFVNDAPQTIMDIAKLVAESFDGHAERIWEGRSARDVKHTMMGIHGVGPGIADMTASLLIRCRGVHFPDEAYIDVKPDVHIRRVLYRLGVAANDTSEYEAIRAAARLHPECPVALDPALWIIGRRWCHPKLPECPLCVAKEVCLYYRSSFQKNVDAL